MVFSFSQEAVEEAAMGNADPGSLTPSQLSVEKLIKEQNFTWKVSTARLCFGRGRRTLGRARNVTDAPRYGHLTRMST